MSGVYKPLAVHQDPPPPTAVGELLDEDESSFEDTLFKGPAEPLDAFLRDLLNP